MRLTSIMNKGVGILLAGSLLLTAQGWTGGAAEAADAGYTYTIYQDTAAGEGTAVQKAEITGYTGEDWDLVIPQTVTRDGTEYPVGRIAKEAFRGNRKVTGVTIPEGVDTIGYGAFYGCTSLKKVAVPATIRRWVVDMNAEVKSNSAFEGCTGLTELSLADGLQCIGERAFYGCSSLEHVRVPSHINMENGTVGEDAGFGGFSFAQCTGLKSVELPEGIDDFGQGVFEGCTALESVHIPSTIKGWFKSMFINTNGIQKSCKPFKGCTGLTSVSFAEGLTTLERFGGFEGCVKLKEITLPSTLQNTEFAFEDCAYLERVRFENGVEKLGPKTFVGCRNLKRVDLPDTLREIEDAFHDTTPDTLTLPPATTKFSVRAKKAVYVQAEKVENYCGVSVSDVDGKLYCLPGTET